MVPKLSDYGIARYNHSPSVGLTFGDFRSVPFAPPENNSGPYTNSRDCYAWAAVALSCLSGRIPNDYSQLTNLLEECDSEEIPIEILRQAISDDPVERPPTASVLQADLDQWIDIRTKLADPILTIPIGLSRGTATYLMDQLGASDQSDLQSLICNELNEIDVGLRATNPDQYGNRGLRIFAIDWIFETYPNKKRAGPLQLTRAWQSRPSEIERLRDASLKRAIRFTFSIQRETVDPYEVLGSLLVDIDAHEVAANQAKQDQLESDVFRVWYAFLRAKADFESRRQNKIKFIHSDISGNFVTLATEETVPLEIVGQSRVIRLGNQAVFCDVVDADLGNIIVEVTGGDRTAIPTNGKLELNTIAAEKAIERQRSALDAVNYDRAASPLLKRLIIDPSICRPPSSVEEIVIPDLKTFDLEKKEVLQNALGLQDILAIQGPPGTGKTRLIEEIIAQYIEINPGHRILLSAQTHVALDNVIERLTKRRAETEIVRIGRIEDPKIGDTSRKFLLDKKAALWSEQVREKAVRYLSDWAAERGISHENIEIGMLVERLILLSQQENFFKNSLSDAKERVRSIEQKSEQKLADTGSADSPALAAESMEALEGETSTKQALDQVAYEIRDVRNRLKEYGGYGAELANSRDLGELKEWSRVLIGSSEDELHCRTLLEIQEEWLLRVGKTNDFHAAMLASAEIVAGTCVGLAGVKGMGDIVYDLCIVDEASKATVTEILVPMSRSRKWILVGDPKQLPPFFEDGSISKMDDFDEEHVKETLLDRLLEGLPDHSKTMLSNQYRMARPIGELISSLFYDDKLASPRDKPDITLPGLFSRSVVWVTTANQDNKSEYKSGQSFKNDAEVDVILQILERTAFIAKNRKSIYSVVVIAGYMAQVKWIRDSIRDHLHDWPSLEITCSTVDSFQGSQADICVYSVTRSNKQGRIGFLKERPRLNVALSRGRDALIIVGDDEFCRTAKGENPFRKILDYIEAYPEDCERMEWK